MLGSVRLGHSVYPLHLFPLWLETLPNTTGATGVSSVVAFMADMIDRENITAMRQVPYRLSGQLADVSVCLITNLKHLRKRHWLAHRKKKNPFVSGTRVACVP